MVSHANETGYATVFLVTHATQDKAEAFRVAHERKISCDYFGKNDHTRT